ncbi:PREDICTED: putative golgin subfamily A member 6-like protein 6 [Vollenhovia emeryi]|uniref:putative golgin subfamily A member 6-like protein 6 n=1 Tax=Vollenhovia emeryi TaxID=411798 RepID=UPI0005F4BC54|nr:PREDICTED: putative golgin subfamily A member 6-like protein 6 [Vollenhovia emeryi]
MEEKGLEVNVEKTKVMRCRKGGGRWKNVTWKWKGKKLEEVKKYKYLGYVMMANGKCKEHLKERVRKGTAVMREVCGIGKRRFRDDWARRLWLFDKLVWTVMSYGVEIWGWREREEVERMHDRYQRWITGVGWRTPGYLVREELMREKMRGRAGMRAWGYERKLGEGREGEIARWCWEEWREKARRGKVVGECERERREFYEEKGWKIEEVERRREEGEIRGEEIVRREKRWQEEERWGKIEKSRSNVWYSWIKGKGVPGYLKKGWKEKRWQRVARFRLGEEMRSNRYWEEEENRKCRVCGREEETWEHIREECTDWGREKGWRDMVEEVLGEEGGGEEWMRKIEEWRGVGIVGEGEECEKSESEEGGGNGGPRYE